MQSDKRTQVTVAPPRQKDASTWSYIRSRSRNAIRGSLEMATQNQLGLLIPGDVSLKLDQIGNSTSALYPEEESIITRAALKRQREFRTGRLLARQALATLGAQETPILRGIDRAPIWPDGYLGSISHTQNLCAALAARRMDYCGIGIDVEFATPLKPDLYTLIGRQEEIEDFSTTVICGNQSIDRAKLTFSIKEAFFKAYYPVTRCLLDFLDARVRISQSDTTFEVHIIPHASLFRQRRKFHGQWTVWCGHIISMILIKAMEPMASLSPPCVRMDNTGDSAEPVDAEQPGQQRKTPAITKE